MKNILSRPVVQLVIIAATGLLIYSNTMRSPFVLDDVQYIVYNTDTKSVGYFFSIKTIVTDLRYFPKLSFAINHAIGGYSVEGYHLVNTLVHILAAVAVYLLARVTFSSPLAAGLYPEKARGYFAFFAAMIFAAHPIQTQVVNYSIQRSASIATLFYVLCIALYATSRKGERTRPALYIASLLAAFVAVKSKEIAFTLPFAVILYDAMFLAGDIKRRLANLAPYLLPLAIIPIAALVATRGDMYRAFSRVANDSMDPYTYLVNQFRVIVTYIRMLFFPSGLNMDHDYPMYHSFFQPGPFLSFVFLALVVVAALYLLRYADRVPEFKIISFGIFWFFIALSVQSSFIPISEIIYDYRVYVATPAFVIAITAAFMILWRKTESTRVVAVMVVIPLILGVAAHKRNEVWHDAESLWRDTVIKSPNKARPRVNLGAALMEKKKYDAAIVEWDAAIKIMKQNPALYDNDPIASALSNIGAAKAAMGDSAGALGDYQASVNLSPDNISLRSNLATAYANAGKLDEAETELREALRRKPPWVDYGEAMVRANLAGICEAKGDMACAVEQYKIALKINPSLDEVRRNLDRLSKRENSLKQN